MLLFHSICLLILWKFSSQYHWFTWFLWKYSTKYGVTYVIIFFCIIISTFPQRYRIFYTRICPKSTTYDIITSYTFIDFWVFPRNMVIPYHTFIFMKANVHSIWLFHTLHLLGIKLIYTFNKKLFSDQNDKHCSKSTSIERTNCKEYWSLSRKNQL